LFCVAADFRTLSRGEESVFLLSHLPSLGLQRYQPKAGQPVALVRQLLDLFQRLSDACVTPQQYLRWAQQQSVMLNSDPIGSAVQNVQIPVVSESNDASVENDSLPESPPSMSAPEIEMASHLELAQCYLTYSELKQRHNVMNFDDLLTEATRLLRERPDRCKTVPIQHIMIDEFQDVNPSLLHFIQALTQVHQHRNIVAVGDADQSIFAFRGSSPSLFDQFLSMFSGAKVASTSINYRSTSGFYSIFHLFAEFLQ
jgi:superfamily I DNA/RNA helicase